MNAVKKKNRPLIFLLAAILTLAAGQTAAAAVERVRTKPGDQAPEGEMILRASV